MRALRKEQLEEHVSGINALLRKANGDVGEDGDTDDAEDGTDEDEFSGFDGPQPEEVDREDEYIDEDKYTTVTIESVGISKEGFEKAGGGDEDAGEGKDKGSGQDKHGKKTKRVWTKEWPKSDRPKKRKVKFRYENKADRKATRMKQDAKKRAQASARKGE
jgi:ribosomal RNA-processing protein 17